MRRVCDDCDRTYANDETFQRHLSEHNCPRGYNRKMNKVQLKNDVFINAK